MDSGDNDARLIAKKLHVNWRHFSASQITRILTDLGGNGAYALKEVDSAVNQCDGCAASEKAPRRPADSTSLASAANEGFKWISVSRET